MTTINSYVSKGFFDEFIQNKPKRILSDEFKLWLNLYRFFDKCLTNLRLGVSRENLAELYNKNDELIRSLVDDYYEGKPNIILENWDEDKEQVKEEIIQHPFQFFFTSSKENIDDTILKKGFPVYNSSNGLMSSSKFLNLEILPVSHNEATNTLKNWRELTEKLLPFYTLTIVDNYLFKSRWQIENNTIPLIRSIAHRAKAKTSFHLTLVYCEEEKKEKINGNFISVLDINGKKIYQNNIDDIYTEIESELIDVFKDSNGFKLSIVRLNESKDFHDRAIFTNSQFMTSGNSFSSYFKGFSGVNLLSPTILTIFPLIGETQKGIWGEIAFEILAYLHSLLESTNKPTIVGEPLENNKLLKQFY
jgi:hypothetical protein